MDHEEKIHPRACETMAQLTVSERRALDAIKQELSRRFHLCFMKLFGSKARGDCDEESDLDVAFVLDELDWETEKAVFVACFEAGLRHDVLVSPIVYSRREWESEIVKATPLYKTLERDGVDL